MKINNEFSIGDVVYLKTDTDQKPRLVTAIKVISGNVVLYEVTQATYVTGHYDYELSYSKDYSLTSIN
jgi:hypothetical protein